LRRTDSLNPEDKATEKKHVLSLVLYIAAIPLAHFHPHLALGAITMVTIIWVLPGLGMEKRPMD
jgi:hypothetical protein